jgi:hypothetical protein
VGHLGWRRRRRLWSRCGRAKGRLQRRGFPRWGLIVDYLARGSC